MRRNHIAYQRAKWERAATRTLRDYTPLGAGAGIGRPAGTFVPASAITATRVGVLRAVLNAIMAAWPTTHVSPQTGRTEPLDTYRLEFVTSIAAWAIDRVLELQGRLGAEVQRLGTGATVDRLLDVNSRIRDRARALGKLGHEVFAARSAGKIAIRSPNLREEVGKLGALIMEGEAAVADTGLEMSWKPIIDALAAVSRASKFVIDAAVGAVRAVIVEPAKALGMLLLKVAAGGLLGYAAIRYFERRRSASGGG